MPLNLGITPNCSEQALTALFEQAGWAITAENPETWYQAGPKKADDRKQYLLIHDRPEKAVAYAIAQGENPEQALETWLIAAQAMVNFYKRHRRKAIMVHFSDLIAEPTTQLRAIAAYLHLPEGNLEQEAPEIHEPPALELLMANQLVRQTPKIGSVLAQVEACTLPAEGRHYAAPAVDLTVVASKLNQLKSGLDESIEERERLQSELLQLQALKQNAEKDNQNSQEKLQNLQDRLDKQLQENQKLKDQLTDLQVNANSTHQESELLLEQLHLVQEELEAQVNICSRQEDKLAQRESNLQSEQAEKNSIEQQLQQTRQENELVLQQLHLVQEALETQFNARVQLENELAESQEQQDYALDAANREITRLQTELNNFKASPAWKATAPVRALKKPFRRANPEKKTLKKHAVLVKQSGLFDESWYLSTYPDVAERGADPIEHYLKFGAEERRNPGPDFDTDWYLTSYPDVAEEGVNPLVHYIKFGQQEGRATNRHHHPSLPAPGTV